MRGFLMLLVALLPTLAHAQFGGGQSSQPAAHETTVRMQVGVVVTARGGLLHHAVATAPVPAEWPEQKVRIVDEDISSAVKSVSYRKITGGGGLDQMVVEIPQLLAGQQAKALVTFEVTRSDIVAPTDFSVFKVPKKLDRALSIDTGPSPFIESRHPKITAAAKEAVGEITGDWQRVEAINQWVRGHVAYKSGELKGAARALFDKEGDSDELTSLFIAMCRAQKIPARTVFVLGACYAEFYLEDADGKGRWFPCQPAGQGTFGAISDSAPILQKGDSFKNPEKPKERRRFVSEYFTSSTRGGKPEVKFVSELVAE